MKILTSLKLLWDFSRPHTIIGSFLSITTLYVLAAGTTQFETYLSLYLLTLIAALGCNIFITGLNQIIDVDMDKISKPFLPIAAGRLSIKHAKIIIYSALLVCLLVAAIVSWWIWAIMVLIILIGIAYSVPPIRLKRHHLPASLCIVVVRGIIVNLGIGYFFEMALHDSIRPTNVILPLTVFMTLFSFAIAWFKDLYDTEGDKAYEVKTLAVLYSIPLAFKAGNAMIILAYLFVVGYGYFFLAGNMLVYTHLILLLGYIIHIFTSSIQERKGQYRFYMGIWVFFFVEYLIFILHGLLNK